jgi:alkylhydroperoxidase family enzyme
MPRKMGRAALLLSGALLAAMAVAASSVAEDAPVARLPLVSEHPDDPALAKMFDAIRARGGAVLNIHRVQGHSPALARVRGEYAYAIRFDTIVQPLLREIAILRVGEILHTEYDRKQHAPMAKACGLTDAQLDALGNWRASTLFDERQRALLGYVDALVVKGGDVDDATFAALRREFNPREIVEITLTVGNYYTTGILTKAFKLQPEADGRASVRGKC